MRKVKVMTNGSSAATAGIELDLVDRERDGCQCT